jgi:hypothetical protein
MLYKLNETGEKTSYFIQALARILIVADQKEHFRKVFKRFYIRFMTGTAMDIFDPVGTRLATKISAADRQFLIQLANQRTKSDILPGVTSTPADAWLSEMGIRIYRCWTGLNFQYC